MFSRGDLVKFAPEYLCTKEMKIDLRDVIGRIDGATAKGFIVCFRVDGKDYKYEFPSFALFGVTDNVDNRSRVASQTSIEVNKDGLFMKFDDGSMYDFKGERYRPGVQGVSEDTAQELINRVKAICGHVSPLERIVFGGGRDYGKSWLKDFDKWNEKIKESLLSESKPESKMTKERCIKLLESYRAEREKVAKGRKFERCLRSCVVDEALERAIELLKAGK